MSSKYNNKKSLLDRNEYFEKRLKYIHPNLTLVGNYTNFTSKVLVRDKYGICKCIASRLLDGAVPCIRTAINKQEYFINQIKEVHGDRYDYSKVNYINSNNKIIIICKNHGEFQQLPCHNHLLIKT